MEHPIRRFTSKVLVGNDCWNWQASIGTEGYGQFWLEGRPVKAHRFAYEALVGPIPDGLFIDHLCRNKACVRPDHLEPVTNRENTRRGTNFIARNIATTHCPQGHAYSPENTYQQQYKTGRQCMACRKARLGA